jgi:hypothetical protein
VELPTSCRSTAKRRRTIFCNDLFVLICAIWCDPIPLGVLMETDDQPASDGTSNELVVFLVRRDTKCAECGCDLPGGSMIMLNKERNPICLACADLNHLEFLRRGNTALTRRAARHSRLRAVVLQWSRTRKRYERQGILAETEAIEQAEAECLEDADRRERQRERRASREKAIDRQYVNAFAACIRESFPGCPVSDARRIAEHACRKYSGRVGRSAAAKQFHPDAIRLAVAAAVRHEFTNYDELLLAGYDRQDARALIRAKVEDELEAWRSGQHVRKDQDPPPRVGGSLGD